MSGFLASLARSKQCFQGSVFFNRRYLLRQASGKKKSMKLNVLLKFLFQCVLSEIPIFTRRDLNKAL